MIEPEARRKGRRAGGGRAENPASMGGVQAQKRVQTAGTVLAEW